MHFATWATICVFAGIASISYRWVILAGTFALWILLPSIAQSDLTGLIPGVNSIPSLHPASFMILSIFTVQFIVKWRDLRSAAADSMWAAGFIGAFLVGIGLTMVSGGANGARLLFDQVVCPVMFFYLVRADLKAKPSNRRYYINTLIGLSLLEVAYGALQWRAHAPLLFAADYGLNFNLSAFLRPPGTLDHPLAFALLLVTCIPFALGMRNSTRQLVVTVVLMFGLLINESRAALVVAVLTMIFLLSRREARPAYKLLIMSGGAVFLLLYVAGFFSLSVAQRFADDAGSTGLRTTAWQFFFEQVKQYVLTGDGLTSNFTTLQNAGLDSSLENPIMMYTFDVGLIFTLCYFVGILRAISWRTPDPISSAAKYSAIIAFITIQTYSSIGTQSAASIILWLVIALANPYLVTPAAQVEESPPAVRKKPTPPVARPATLPRQPHQRRTTPMSTRPKTPARVGRRERVPAGADAGARGADARGAGARGAEVGASGGGTPGPAR